MFVIIKIEINTKGFSDGSAVTSLPANAGGTGSIPDLERSHMLRSN